MSKKKKFRAERKELKQQYELLFKQVSAALFAEDPININFGGNTDEYDPETGTILPRLKEATTVSDVQVILYEEFVRWFGISEAGARDSYASLAAEVWALCQEFRSRRLIQR